MAFFTGTTVRVWVTFEDFVQPGGATPLIDPDVVLVTIYNSSAVVLNTGIPLRFSQGVYFYDWITPGGAGSYIAEFNGTINGYPNIIRQQFGTVFD